MEKGQATHTTIRRPRELAEVVAWAAGDPSLMDALLREFLDTSYSTPDAERGALLEAAPELTGDPKTDAYLGSVAEHLARRYGEPVPPWTEAPQRFLTRAHFPCGLESLKATLLVESPPAFRRRLIFVGADPLYRPRRAEAPERGLEP